MAGRPRNSELALQETENDVEVLESPKKKKSSTIQVPKRMTLQLVKDTSGIIRRGNSSIDCIDDVYDPETGETRRARVIRGATSIWQDEQTNFPKEYVVKNRLALTFEGNVCILNDTAEDKLKKQFATLCNSRWENEHRTGVRPLYFEIFDPVRLDAKELEQENLSLEAMQLAATQPKEKMYPHAHYLGISFVNNVDGEPVGEGNIRKEYMRKAKADPKKFMDSVDAPIVTTSYLIKQAIEESKIDLGKMKGQAYWANGGFICQIPAGQTPSKYLIEFALMPREESINFVNQLKTIFSKQ